MNFQFIGNSAEKSNNHLISLKETENFKTISRQMAPTKLHQSDINYHNSYFFIALEKKKIEILLQKKIIKINKIQINF